MSAEIHVASEVIAGVGARRGDVVLATTRGLVEGRAVAVVEAAAVEAADAVVEAVRRREPASGHAADCFAR